MRTLLKLGVSISISTLVTLTVSCGKTSTDNDTALSEDVPNVSDKPAVGPNISFREIKTKTLKAGQHLFFYLAVTHSSDDVATILTLQNSNTSATLTQLQDPSSASVTNIPDGSVWGSDEAWGEGSIESPESTVASFSWTPEIEDFPEDAVVPFVIRAEIAGLQDSAPAELVFDVQVVAKQNSIDSPTGNLENLTVYQLGYDDPFEMKIELLNGDQIAKTLTKKPTFGTPTVFPEFCYRNAPTNIRLTLIGTEVITPPDICLQLTGKYQKEVYIDADTTKGLSNICYPHTGERLKFSCPTTTDLTINRLTVSSSQSSPVIIAPKTSVYFKDSLAPIEATVVDPSGKATTTKISIGTDGVNFDVELASAIAGIEIKQNWGSNATTLAEHEQYYLKFTSTNSEGQVGTFVQELALSNHSYVYDDGDADGLIISGNDMKDLFDVGCNFCHGNSQTYAFAFRSDDFDVVVTGIKAQADNLISILDGPHRSAFSNDVDFYIRKMKLWKLNGYKK